MTNVYSRVERWKTVHSWARIENFLSLYSYTHDRFCAKCRSNAENEDSGALLLDWVEREEYLPMGKNHLRTDCHSGTGIGR